MSVAWLALLVGGRVLFSSLANVFQKKLVERSGDPRAVVTSSLLVVALLMSPWIAMASWGELSWQFWLTCVIAALLDVPGNVLLVGSLGKSDLSLVGPLNSLKPVVGMLLGIPLLGEIPTLLGLLGVLILAAGTWSLAASGGGVSSKARLAWLISPGARWRFGALLLTAASAVFLKPAVQMAGPWTTFAVWSGLCASFSVAWHQLDRHRSFRQNIFELSHWSAPIFGLGILFCGLQGLSIGLFQWMPVSYALALFQLSGVLNVYLGYRFFGERGGWHRLLISLVMLAGAALILLG